MHITAAVIWVGGGVMLSIIGARARRTGDIALLGDFARTLSYVGLRVFTPAVIVVLITGVWLVLAEQSGDFSRLWVVLALVAFAAAFLIGAMFLSRTAIRLERVATGPSPDLQSARDALGAWLIGYAAVVVILVFAIWDMVFKPRL